MCLSSKKCDDWLRETLVLAVVITRHDQPRPVIAASDDLRSHLDQLRYQSIISWTRTCGKTRSERVARTQVGWFRQAITCHAVDRSIVERVAACASEGKQLPVSLHVRSSAKSTILALFLLGLRLDNKPRATRAPRLGARSSAMRAASLRRRGGA